MNRSNEGNSWTPHRVQSGANTLQLGALAASSTSLFVGVGFDSKSESSCGVFKSTDDGATWFASSNGLPPLSYVDDFAVLGSKIVCSLGCNDSASTAGGLFISSDDGTTWQRDTAWPQTDSIASDLVAVQGVLFAQGENLNTFPGQTYRSADTGASWRNIDIYWTYDPEPTSFNSCANVGSIWFAGVGGSSIGILSKPSQGPPTFALYRSTDSGYFWEVYDTVWADNVVVIGDTIYAAGYLQYHAVGYMHVSTDAGKSWYIMDTSGLGYPISLMGIFYPLDLEDHLLLGNHGPHLWDGHKSQWVDIGQGLNPNSSIANIAVLHNKVFAIADGGIWYRPLSEILGPQNAVQEMPQKNEEQFHIYPNPLSQSLTISFTSEVSGHADVSIFNPLGTEVAKIFSGEVTAGEQTFQWVPKGLPDGVYECVVRMNGGMQELPMDLMR